MGGVEPKRSKKAPPHSRHGTPCGVNLFLRPPKHGVIFCFCFTYREMAGGGKGSHPECHFAASGVAAIINFPLWRAAAIGQSGFDKDRGEKRPRNKKNFLRRYRYPPGHHCREQVGGTHTVTAISVAPSLCWPEQRWR